VSRGQRGAASLLAVALLSVLLLVGSALGVVAAIVWAHRTAQAAADLSALAGAAELQEGENACVAARRVSGANHARLTSCRVQGEEVMVEVMVTGPRWLGQDEDLSASARAGPG
jgi:secretion/DNA translocation related TadE-like protein